jgi:LuxR family transcriptional regulator, maltose regulon positive regulatory protein
MGGPGMGGPGRAGPPGRDSTEGQGGIVAPETTLLEPLSETEMRVLRYLPTNLTTQEIGGELYLSANTIKTHIRHLYLKLGAHRRGEAVQLARAMGLLAPSPRRY